MADSSTETRDGVTLGEIVRTLADMREELRALRSEHVRRDLYEAHRAETTAQLSQLRDRLAQAEEERRSERVRADEDRAQWRRQLTLAGVTAALSLAVAVISAIIH